MRKHISILIIVILFSINALSQNIGTDTTPDSTQNAYAYGIQYYFINGIFFGFKFNDQFPGVWRLKLDFSGSIASNSSFSKSYNSYDELTGENEHNSNNGGFDFGISFEYNYFFPVHKRFKPYIGLGPLLNYSYAENRSEQKSDIPSGHSTATEFWRKNYGIGLIAVGGVESELIDFISLFLEYNLTYTYYLSRSELRDYSPINDLRIRNEGTGHQYVFSLSSANLGIIIFF